MEKNNCGKEREELINCFMFFGKEMMFTNYKCREYLELYDNCKKDTKNTKNTKN